MDDFELSMVAALLYTWFMKEGRPFCLAWEQGAAATSRGLVTSVPNSEARLATVPQSYRHSNDCRLLIKYSTIWLQSKSTQGTLAPGRRLATMWGRGESRGLIGKSK
jgi:hypothetical protein